MVDFVTGGEKSPVLPILRRVSETKEKLEIREFRAKNEDGIEFWVNWSAIPIENGTGRADLLVMIQEDVTERKRVEEVLKESEEKFSRAFHGSSASTYITRLSDGKIIHANDQGLKMLEYGKG